MDKQASLDGQQGSGPLGTSVTTATEPVSELLERLRGMPKPNSITAAQRTEMYQAKSAATELLTAEYEPMTCSELLDIAVAAHPDGFHFRDDAADARSNAALALVDRRHPGVDVVAEWEATDAPTFIEAVRALYDAHDPNCQVHRRFEG